MGQTSDILLEALELGMLTLDTPGSVVRGLAGGHTNRALQGILDPQQRVYGSELAQQWNLTGENTPGQIDANDLVGFGLDVGLDPMTWPLAAVAGYRGAKAIGQGARGVPRGRRLSRLQAGQPARHAERATRKAADDIGQGLQLRQADFGPLDAPPGTSLDLRHGGQQVGQFSYGPMGGENRVARRMFPDILPEGDDVARIHGAYVDKEFQGMGAGKHGMLAGMIGDSKTAAEAMKRWAYNSGNSEDATRAINALERDGLAEVHWWKGRKGGVKIIRPTEKGFNAVKSRSLTHPPYGTGAGGSTVSGVAPGLIKGGPPGRQFTTLKGEPKKGALADALLYNRGIATPESFSGQRLLEAPTPHFKLRIDEAFEKLPGKKLNWEMLPKRLEKAGVPRNQIDAAMAGIGAQAKRIHGRPPETVSELQRIWKGDSRLDIAELQQIWEGRPGFMPLTETHNLRAIQEGIRPEIHERMTGLGTNLTEQGQWGLVNKATGRKSNSVNIPLLPSERKVPLTKEKATEIADLMNTSELREIDSMTGSVKNVVRDARKYQRKLSEAHSNFMELIKKAPGAVRAATDSQKWKPRNLGYGNPRAKSWIEEATLHRDSAKNLADEISYLASKPSNFAIKAYRRKRLPPELFGGKAQMEKIIRAADKFGLAAETAGSARGDLQSIKDYFSKLQRQGGRYSGMVKPARSKEAKYPVQYKDFTVPGGEEGSYRELIFNDDSPHLVRGGRIPSGHLDAHTLPGKQLSHARFDNRTITGPTGAKEKIRFVQEVQGPWGQAIEQALRSGGEGVAPWGRSAKAEMSDIRFIRKELPATGRYYAGQSNPQEYRAHPEGDISIGGENAMEDFTYFIKSHEANGQRGWRVYGEDSGDLGDFVATLSEAEDLIRMDILRGRRADDWQSLSMGKISPTVYSDKWVGMGINQLIRTPPSRS